MSLFPPVKIANDHLDDRALEKLGFALQAGPLGKPVMHLAGRALMGLGRLGLGMTRLAGRGAWGGAKLFGRTAQGTGEFIVNHPRMALGVGAPIVYGASQLPENIDLYQNNIYPENPYKY